MHAGGRAKGVAVVAKSGGMAGWGRDMLAAQGRTGEAVAMAKFGGGKAGCFKVRPSEAESEVSRTSCSCDDGCGGWHDLAGGDVRDSGLTSVTHESTALALAASGARCSGWPVAASWRAPTSPASY